MSLKHKDIENKTAKTEDDQTQDQMLKFHHTNPDPKSVT